MSQYIFYYYKNEQININQVLPQWLMQPRNIVQHLTDTWRCLNAAVIGLHSSSLQASTLCFNNNIVRIIYDFTSCYTGINYQTNVHSNANSTSCANDSAVVSFNLYNMKQYFFIQTYTYSVRHTVHNVKEIQNWHIISAILLQGKM